MQTKHKSDEKIRQNWIVKYLDVNKLIKTKDVINKNIRRTWFNDEWGFVAVDIIEVLRDSRNPSNYLKDMRKRDDSFNKGWGQIATPLSVE
jgi:hypothetical protein